MINNVALVSGVWQSDSVIHIHVGHLMQAADLLEKSLMLGKMEGRKRGSPQRVRWLGSITDAMDMKLGKLLEMVRDREACHASAHGVAKCQTPLGNRATGFFSNSFLISVDHRILSRVPCAIQ